MIIRITYRNILSFKEETTISFVAGKSTAHPEHVLRGSSRNDISILKTGIIYGANASGKSNIIKGVHVLKSLALGKFPKRNFGQFKLSESNNSSSKIEVEFRMNKKFYAYGIELDANSIQEEWLYEINSRTDKMLFTRKISGSEQKFNFLKIRGEKTEQFLFFLANGTPKDKSFISEYVQRNGKGISQISDAFNWFEDKLHILFPESRFHGISFKAEQDKKFQQSTCKLLTHFNTGMSDIRRVEIEEGKLDIPEHILEKLTSELEPGKTISISSSKGNQTYFIDMDETGNTRYYKQKTVHKNEQGDEVIFEETEESDGSIRLTDFIPMLIHFKHYDDVFLIDEIDRSLHPFLSKRILECYFSLLTEARETQLICTTHESNLLDLDIIRSDEVWLIEKDKHVASHCTSLAEYKPREDVKKGYLHGRYGAIPFFASLESLNWGEEN